MITRTELTAYLDNFLSVAKIQDYAPNGLQIEGRSEIRKICTAVTASQAALEQAIAAGADALLVHHGYFWRGEDSVVCGIKRARLALTLAENLNLFAYHLPIDVHPELGNNVCFGRLLGAVEIKTHDVGKTPGLLMSGRLKSSMSLNELSAYLTQKLGRIPQILAPSSHPIQHVAWCTGAAQDYIEEASKLGIDAYLSGEVSLRTYYEAHELKLPYIACGHHATERYGIKALGEHIAQKFGVLHHFIDSENPV